MAKARDVSIRIAVAEAEQAINRLRAIGKEGEQAFQRLAKGAGSVPAAAQQVDRASGQMRGALGGVAQQVQDVAVQFQSGTSTAIIFAQQGPQIAGAFGPVGAMIGALAGVTAVAASAFLGFGKDVDTAKAATDAMEAATKSLDGTIAGSASSVDDLARKYRVLSEEMGVIERLELGKTIRESEAALSAIRDQIAASVQAARDSGQLPLLQQSEALARLDPGAVRDSGVAQLQQFLEGVDAALAKSAKGGLTQFADEVDRLATSLPKAGGDARSLADSFIAPAEGAIKLAQAIRQAQVGLDALAGKASSGPDPFLDQAKAAEQAEKAIDKATKASERAVAQSDRRAAALALEIQQNARLIEAGAKSAAAYEAMRRQIEAENRVVAAGLDPKGKEAALLAEQNAQLAAQAQARRDNTRALNEQMKAIDAFYDRAGKQIDSMFAGEAQNDNRDVLNLQRNLQTNVASAIERGFEDGFGSVGDVVDQFGSLLKSTVATALADQLITEGLAKSLSGALGTQLGKIVPSLAGTRAGTATVGGAATAGLGSALGGYAIGQSTGSRPLGLLGGAATGAAAGAPLGLYGFAAGAVIGGLDGFIGGGAGGGERNNNYIGGYDPLTGRPVEFRNTRPDPGNTSNVGSVLSQLDALRDGLRGLNIALGETELTIQSGNRSGLTLNGESFSSLGGLTEAAFDRLLAAASLTEEQKRVAAASNATDAAGLLADLGFIDEFKQLTGTMSALDVQAKALETTFGTARDRATELAFSQAELTALGQAERQAQRELQQQAGRDRGNILDYAQATMGDGAAALRTALRNQATEFDRLREQLEALGGTAAQLRELSRDEAEARAHLTRITREQAEAERQQAREQFQAQGQGLLGQVQSTFGFLDSLRDFRAGLGTSDLSPGTTLDQYRAARAQFQETRRLALGGNLDAINDLSAQGQQLLQLSREVNASGAGYSRDFNSVQSALDRLIAHNQNREDRLIDALEALGVGQVTTIQQQTRALQDELKKLVDEGRKVAELLRRSAFNSAAQRNAA